LIAAPIIVHVVEDNTVLYTVGGTLLGVALGGFLAWLQQRSKIGADKDQLKDRLSAEETRLDKQLKNDRELQHLAELRSVLDEATVALEETIHELQNLFASFHGETPKAGGEEAQGILDRLLEEQHKKDMQKSADARDRMMLAGQRLAIRIGDGDALSSTYKDAIKLAVASIRDVYAENRQQEAGVPVYTSEFEKRHDELAGVRRTFVEQAVARVGSQVP
jgi:hypothetical protein